MKYYYEKPESWTNAGQTYICDHPLYNRCTLFKKGKKGLAIIQEHFNEKTKARWWGTIEPWLASDIYLNDNFRSVFDQFAKEIDEKDQIEAYYKNKYWSDSEDDDEDDEDEDDS